MTQTMPSAARDITYANAAQTRAGRGFIRLMENASGRVGLIKRARGYEDQVQQGQDFWQVMCERYGIRLNVVAGGLHHIPTSGPLVVVSNHPFGILDGLMMGHILSQVRGDFRIVAHRVFQRAEDINRVILPISFDETKDGLRTNMQTRKAALSYLGQGGAVGIFPGGTVSTAATPLGLPMDPVWRNFTAKMVMKSDAVVVPIFFVGRNSRLFQIASHLHSSLRMGLLIREFRKKTDQTVDIVVGQPIPRAALAHHATAQQVMAFLRQQTYSLCPDAIQPDVLGHEFEARYKG